MGAIDRRAVPSGLPLLQALGLAVPAVKAEDAIGLGKGEPALDIGER